MGKTKGRYNAEFPAGTIVRVQDRPFLEQFKHTWKFHNKLTDSQLDYAGTTAPVLSVGFYHGGDELYQLEGVPGVWHEQCLSEV